MAPMSRRTDQGFSFPEVGSKNWAEASIGQQYIYNVASKSARIERETQRINKSRSSSRSNFYHPHSNVDILRLDRDESDNDYEVDEDDEELFNLYNVSCESEQEKKKTKISFSSTDNVCVFDTDLPDITRSKCPKPRRKTIDDNITVIGRTVLYKGRHSARVEVMSRISDVSSRCSVDSPLTTPRNVPSTRGSVPSTPRNVPTTPSIVLSTPGNVPSMPRNVLSTPGNVPNTPKHLPSTPALVCAQSGNNSIEAGKSDSTTAIYNNNSSITSQINSFINGKSHNNGVRKRHSAAYPKPLNNSSETKKLRSALPPVQKTIANYLPSINTRASQSIHLTKSSANMPKESQGRYKQPKVLNNTITTSFPSYKPEINTMVKLPDINKPNSGRVSEKADRNRKSTIPVLPTIKGPRVLNCGSKRRGRQGL